MLSYLIAAVVSGMWSQTKVDTQALTATRTVLDAAEVILMGNCTTQQSRVLYSLARLDSPESIQQSLPTAGLKSVVDIQVSHQPQLVL